MAGATDKEMTAALEQKKQQWLSALCWRRRMKAALEPCGLTFTEWLVLDATRSLVSRTGDCVSQNDVARDIEIDAMATWHAMAVLDHRGLVSRGCSMSGKAWRVFVTEEGLELLHAVQPDLERVSISEP